MDVENFLEFGKSTMDFIADYTENLRDRDVLPSVEPGYLSELIPKEAPQKAESWRDVLQDVERVIMPGITHWNSPRFFAYYPTANSYPAIIGELLSAAIGCMGFSWMASPACTELEAITMNWLGKMLGLPEEFLNCSEGPGGGVLQGSASEATLVGLLTAKDRTTRRIKKLHPDWDEGMIKAKLVAYSSDQSNSSVEKAGLLGSMKMRLLKSDDKCRLRGSTLLEAIQEDEAAGLIPCYVVATLGTTGTCAFDVLDEIGPICNDRHIWLHVDAAYAGAAFICPEYRHMMSGLEYADSFNVNAHKWLLVNFDCSAMWLKDSRSLIEAFNVDRIYLAQEKGRLAPEYRHWQISLGRRFRSLKLWFVLRMYGVEGLQNHIRKSVKLAEKFEQRVRADDRFETVVEISMGLVCFRLKGDNSLTKDLLAALVSRKKIYVVPTTYKDKMLIRFVICSRLCEEADIDFAWNEIRDQATEILQSKFPAIGKHNCEIATRIESLNLDAKESEPKIS